MLISVVNLIVTHWQQFTERLRCSTVRSQRFILYLDFSKITFPIRHLGTRLIARVRPRSRLILVADAYAPETVASAIRDVVNEVRAKQLK